MPALAPRSREVLRGEAPQEVLILLIGPKGSGKSHIGRWIERRLGVHFLPVETLWMSYHAECRTAGREPSIPEGIGKVYPKISQALAIHRHVCVETTGASAEILSALLSLAPPQETLVIRISAPLELCLERIAARDPIHQIPMAIEEIRKLHELSARVAIDSALVLENQALSESEIVSSVASALATRASRPAGTGQSGAGEML